MIKSLILFPLLGATYLFPLPAYTADVCQLVSHANKLSLADFAESPNDTDDFFYQDTSDLTREGQLTIVGRLVEVSFDDVSQTYECKGSRNAPCIGVFDDGHIIGEVKVDFALATVIELEANATSKPNPFSRGGIANAGFRIWNIENCQ